MRAAAVTQWVRAAIEHPESRTTASRYAIGITVVQLLWIVRAVIPDVPWWVFVVLVAAELAVPLVAERSGMTAWHPHHVAERYGLFTIIVLGESVLAATTGVQDALGNQGVTAALIIVSASGLALMFALWWLYFLEPAGDGLSEKRGLSYFWGYSHYGIFAALAALGAGLEVAVEASVHHVEVSNVTVAYAIALPVGVFLVLLWAAHAPLVTRLVIRPAAILPAAVAVLLLPLASPALGLPATVVLIALACVAVVTVTLIDKTRGSRMPGSVATSA
jgi:low temperature requirement protein LtrA